MANIPEESAYPVGIVQLEAGQIFTGGPSGLTNVQAIGLGNRTRWLKDQVDVLLTSTGLSAIRGPVMPLDALAFPTVQSADNCLAVGTANGTNGGKVTVSAGQVIAVGLETVEGVSGQEAAWATSGGTWDSGWLAESSVFYLRCQENDGTLLLYTAKGTDADAVPSSRKGVANATSGCGFPSTVLDAKLATITTHAAGSTPTVVLHANAPPRRERADLLSLFRSVKSTSPVQCIADGLIIQCMYCVESANSADRKLFPEAFPTACVFACGSPIKGDSFAGITIGSLSETGIIFTFGEGYGDGTPGWIMAIGY